MPLQSRFLTQLDVRSDKLLKLFEKRGGQIGKRLERTLAPMTQEDYVDAGRECVLKWLCVYLNEDPANLVREFVAEDEAAIKESIEDTTVGIFVVKNDATSGPEDVGIVLEGLQIMQGLDNTALAAAILFGLMYVLNLNYPPELKNMFEVRQIVVMELDGTTLSKKAQVLKNRLSELLS